MSPGAVYPGLPTQTSLQRIIPAYPYVEYSDDDDIRAFFGAYNQMAGEYLLWFNTANLPIYTGGIVAGALLDWVGQGLYGIARPSVTTGAVFSAGAMNAFAMNTVAMNGRRIRSTLSNQQVNDDIYRRVLTWNLYKGDGFTFSIQWLKRRVLRFLNGANGISPVIDQTYAVSVAVAGNAYTIAVPSANPMTVALLNALIQSGACITPFQYSFSISTVLGASGLQNNAGFLQVTDAAGWPSSASGLSAGALWDAGGAVYVMPATSPNPAVAPALFGNITAAQLLALGGGNLPNADPVNLNQIWNNAGVACVSLGI